MAKKISEPGNAGGWIEVSALLTFNTLKDAGTTHRQILDAAENLHDRLEVDRKGGSDSLGAIRLRGGVATFEAMVSPQEMKREDERTLYISPLPADMTRDVLTAALGPQFGADIAYISLPRARGRAAGAGFGFVEFSSVGVARECALALEAKEIPEFGRRFPLARGISRTKWKELKESKRTQARKQKKKKAAEGKRTRKDNDSGTVPTEEISKAPVGDGKCGSIQPAGGHSTEAIQPPSVTFQAGVIVVASGYDLPTSRGALRELLEKLGQGTVAYVDYKSSAPESSVCRFAEADAASRATKAAAAPLSLELLSGKDEERYWEGVLARSRDKRSRATAKAERRQ